MKTLTNTIERISKEKAYEAEWSLTEARVILREVISTIDTTSLVEAYYKYVEAIKDSSIEHKEYHIGILEVWTPKFSKVLEIIGEEFMTSSVYVDYDVVAYRLGLKLSPKKFMVNGETFKASTKTKLRFGANILQFLAHSGYVAVSSKLNDEKHFIRTITSDKLVRMLKEKGIQSRYYKVRKGAPAYKIRNHTAENGEGGYYNEGMTMLNSRGFNHNTTQSQSVCDALNKVQNVPYTLTNGIRNILTEYKDHRKWFSDSGLFMSNEWNKLIDDINRFRDETFHFPFAMDDRGRLYDRGSYLSVQGDSFQKAMLEIDGHTIHKFDARNSGLQVYSMLGKDHIGGKLCGMNGTDGDAYQALADALNKELGKPDLLDRDSCKKGFMTFLYGQRALMLQAPIEYKTSKHYNKTLASLGVTWDMLENAMKTIAPAAIKLMNLIYAFNDERTAYDWTMPDGFNVHVTNTETLKVVDYFVDLKDSKTHQVSIDTTIPASHKGSRALAPNIIHSIDAYIMREVIRRADFYISPIHDSFGVTEENIEAVQKLYKEVIIDVMESNVLEGILHQINPNIGFKIFKGQLTAEMIRASAPLSED